jgi:hypothetical protein
MHPFLESNLELIQYAPAFFAISISIFMGLGWLFGIYRAKKRGENNVVVRDSLAAAIFGLSALVLSFTFSSALNHYDTRIEAVRTQAYAIKEVYLSASYLQTADQIALRKSLMDLLDLRLTAYKDNKTINDVNFATDKISNLVRKINEDVARSALNAPSVSKAVVGEILVPQMRNLVSVFSAGAIKNKSHPPKLLMRFLYFLLCIGGVIIGYTMAVKNESDWFLAAMYLLIMGIGLHVILSLENPNLLMPYTEFNRDLLLLKDSLPK